MPTYRYQMRTSGGEVSVGMLTADNALGAAQQLRAAGHTVLQLTPMSTRVNAVRNDDAALAEPMTLTAANEETPAQPEAALSRADAPEDDLAREPVQEKLF